jgi:hypothetical protein
MLQEYEQLSDAGRDTAPVTAILARETRFPKLDKFLQSELGQRQRSVDWVAEQLVSYQPKSASFDRVFGSAIMSMLVGLGVLVMGSFIWGTIVRPAPCGTPDFITGGFFGAMICTCVFGLPVAGVSLLLGGLVGAVRRG